MHLSNTIKKSQFLIIDKWDLVYQKSELSKTKWWINTIDKLSEMLLNMMTNKIIW